MSKRLKRLAASSGLVVALGMGAILMAPSKASAATPCGLSGVERSLPGGFKIYYYTIRQCNGSTVRRKLDIAGTTDGSCHTIPGNSQVSSSRIYYSHSYVRGIKPC